MEIELDGEVLDLEELLEPEVKTSEPYAVLRFYGKTFHIKDSDDPDEVMLKFIAKGKHHALAAANPKLHDELVERYRRLYG